MQKRHYWFILCLLGITGFFNACENGCNGSSGPTTSDIKEFKMNGYLYTHHIQNDGPKANPTEFVFYHYLMLADDSLLSSSYEINHISNMQVPPAGKQTRPQPILDGLKMMSPGDSMTIKIPLDSIPNVPIGFGKYENLIYEVAVTEVLTQEEKIKRDQAKVGPIQAQREADMAREGAVKDALAQRIEDIKAGKLDDQLQTTASGLKYIIHEKGTGYMPRDQNPIKVHYYAMLPDGTPFDNSFKNGNPYFFTLGAGQVYRGWDEAIAMLPIGTKASLVLPPSLLVFGENSKNPNVPPDSDMYFYIETFYPYN